MENKNFNKISSRISNKNQEKEEGSSNQRNLEISTEKSSPVKKRKKPNPFAELKRELNSNNEYLDFNKENIYTSEIQNEKIPSNFDVKDSIRNNLNTFMSIKKDSNDINIADNDRYNTYSKRKENLNQLKSINRNRAEEDNSRNDSNENITNYADRTKSNCQTTKVKNDVNLPITNNKINTKIFDLGEYLYKVNSSKSKIENEDENVQQKIPNLSNRNINKKNSEWGSEFYTIKQRGLFSKNENLFEKLKFDDDINNKNDFKLNHDIKHRGSLKDDNFVSNCFYNYDFFRENFERFFNQGMNVKKIKSTNLFLSKKNLLKKYQIKLFIPEFLHQNECTVIDLLQQDKINYKILSEFEINLSKLLRTNQNQNKNNKNKRIPEENEEIIKNNFLSEVKKVKLSDIDSIIFGNFTSNLIIYTDIINNLPISVIRDGPETYNDGNKDKNEILAWKCFSIIMNNNKTYDFISENEEEVFSIYLLLSILISIIKNKGNQSQDLNINDCNSNINIFKNFETPRNSSMRKTINFSTQNIKGERGYSINPKTSAFKNFNDTHEGKNMQFENSLDFDRKKFSNNNNHMTIKSKNILIEKETRRKMNNSVSKSRIRSKSNYLLSDLAKTKNDTKMKNFGFGVTNEFNENETLTNNKNKFEMIMNKIKDDQAQKFSNISFTKSFKQFVNIFLWNRTYLKIKANYKNIRYLLENDEIY